MWDFVYVDRIVSREEDREAQIPDWSAEAAELSLYSGGS